MRSTTPRETPRPTAAPTRRPDAMTDQTRPYNFAPGPAAIPEAVLREAAAEMLDWHGGGAVLRERTHRGRESMQSAAEAQADLRELLAVPADFRILFLQGGGLGE